MSVEAILAELAALRAADLPVTGGTTWAYVYDSGSEAAELMAETAAIHGCHKVLIGTSRKGALYHLIKGHFQTRLESVLPPDIKVQVLHPEDHPASHNPPPPPPPPAPPAEKSAEEHAHV